MSHSGRSRRDEDLNVFPQVPRGLLATLEQRDTKEMPGALADQAPRGP